MTNSWLRWAGSKWRALSALRSVLENRSYNYYVDPFVGAGSVYFKLARPVNAVLSDINKDLMSFYLHLQRNPDELWRLLSKFPLKFSRDFYVDLRETFNALPPGLERAATFFFLNRTCFNGIYRVNRHGEFNVPVGSRRRFLYPPLTTFHQLSKRLQAAQILDCDFELTARHARRGVLYYLDPPYTETQLGSSYNRYAWPPFRRADLERLQDFVVTIVSRGAHVIVSYAGSKMPWFLPRHFGLKRLKVFRSISSDGSRGDKAEICAFFWQGE
jgi:DNA adenine methylase